MSLSVALRDSLSADTNASVYNAGICSTTAGTPITPVTSHRTTRATPAQRIFGRITDQKRLTGGGLAASEDRKAMSEFAAHACQTAGP